MSIKIRTQRNYQTWPSWDLVYEWEDVLAKELHASFVYESTSPDNKHKKNLSRFYRTLFAKRNTTLVFDMVPLLYDNQQDAEETIPCIVDFYLKKEQMPLFEKAYSRNPMVLISSREAFDFLKKNDCKLNIEHFPLSISDKYRITPDTCIEKEYDLVLMGRQNPVLESFLKQYEKEHSSFRYVYRRECESGKFCYSTSDGEALGNIDTREQYWRIMRKGRCALYSTPGMDGGESRTNGFNQVTPRFLEIIACGCHVIARYRPNSDTEFYELDNFCPSIEDYSSFERILDNALNTEVDMDVYANYLSKHYTSVRGRQLLTLLKK